MVVDIAVVGLSCLGGEVEVEEKEKEKVVKRGGKGYRRMTSKGFLGEGREGGMEEGG